MLSDVARSWVTVERARNGATRVSAVRAFTQQLKKLMCWQLLPAPVIEGQQQRLPLLSTEEWMDKKKFFDTSTEMVQQDGVELNEEKSTMEKISKHVWASHVKDEFDLANLIQTK